MNYMREADCDSIDKRNISPSSSVTLKCQCVFLSITKKKEKVGEKREI